MKYRRFWARLALVLIAVLLCAMLAFAFSDSPNAKGWLMAALFCLIVVPAVIYGVLMFTKATERKEDQESEK